MVDISTKEYENRWRLFARSNHHYVDQKESVMGKQFLEGLRHQNPDIYLRARILNVRVNIDAPIGVRVTL